MSRNSTGVASVVRQHSRILVQLARIGMRRKSQFTVEFWCQVLMDFCWYAAHIGVFEVLYVHTHEIAGWKREDFRVLIGFLFVSDAFMMIWLGQLWRFGRDVKDGALDPYRVRPASTFVLYGFGQFSPEGCVNMLMAFGYLLYAIAVAIPDAGLTTALVAACAVALSLWARIVLAALFALLDLRFVGSDFGQFLREGMGAIHDRPFDLFGRRTRLFLLYALPLGALTQVPASLVLGHYSPLEGTLCVLWFVEMGWLTIRAFTAGLSRYESAMG
jgi:ABC-type uncharacterized transport system permease subunit